MIVLPNPFESASADKADVSLFAPVPGASAEPTAGVKTPAGFSSRFIPDFEKMFDEIMSKMPPQFVTHPSKEYLRALEQRLGIK
jgi:hypothetical protein